MAAIGRFQKGNDLFHAKVVDGELFRLHGDVFGSPSFDKQPTPRKGVKTLVPVVPSSGVAAAATHSESWLVPRMVKSRRLNTRPRMLRTIPSSTAVTES